MAKRKYRTDAERRVRQSERLSRLFRVFRCIMGAGRWDAQSLARELEVSERTVHRLMQTLSMAGVPWYFCKEHQCYRVRPGFRFPGFDVKRETGETTLDLSIATDRILDECQRLSEALSNFSKILRNEALNPRSHK